MLCKIGVFKTLAKFTGKHVCWRLSYNKIAGLACNFIKRETTTQVFSSKFCEIFRNTFYYGTPPGGLPETYVKRRFDARLKQF